MLIHISVYFFILMFVQYVGLVKHQNHYDRNIWQQSQTVETSKGKPRWRELLAFSSAELLEKAMERERERESRVKVYCGQTRLTVQVYSVSTGLEVPELLECPLLGFQILWFPVGFSLNQPSADGLRCPGWEQGSRWDGTQTWDAMRPYALYKVSSCA